MGSSNSKDNAGDTFEHSEKEEEDNKWVNNNNQNKEKTKVRSMITKVPSKHTVSSNLTKSRTIVDLSSADSDSEYHQNKVNPEAELREDINRLEMTLSSLGLERRVKQVKVNETMNSRSPAHSDDNERGYLTSSTSVGRITNVQKKYKRRKRDLRFSWDENQGGGQLEDWTVQEVRIVIN